MTQPRWAARTLGIPTSKHIVSIRDPHIEPLSRLGADLRSHKAFANNNQRVGSIEIKRCKACLQPCPLRCGDTMSLRLNVAALHLVHLAIYGYVRFNWVIELFLR